MGLMATNQRAAYIQGYRETNDGFSFDKFFLILLVATSALEQDIHNRNYRSMARSQQKRLSLLLRAGQIMFSKMTINLCLSTNWKEA